MEMYGYNQGIGLRFLHKDPLKKPLRYYLQTWEQILSQDISV